MAVCFSKNPQKSIAKAIFLDRDGTLNVDYGYVYQPEKIHLLPGVPEALDFFIKKDFLLFLFTNQPGIERGMYTRQDVEACHQQLQALLGPSRCFQEICIAAEAEVAPHHYRKPSPRFILEMLEKYHLDPQQSYMVGDKETDAFAGLSGGIHSILLDSDYPRSERCKTLITEGRVRCLPTLLDFARTLA